MPKTDGPTGGEFPAGGIILWSGTVAAIPTGWVICDGANGTPDLTDSFVIHADDDSGGTRDVGDTGGAHTTTIAEANLPAHVHTIDHAHDLHYQGSAISGGGYLEIIGQASSYDSTNSATVASHSGNSGSIGSGTAASTIPKFYALAYIMKT